MNRKGFTLIELLVVIAIIGILSGIVLVSVNSARNKAKDTAVKGGLDQIRIAGEMAYDTAGSYDVCTEGAAGAGNSTLLATGDFGRIATNIQSNDGNVAPICNESANSAAYAAWAPLVATTGTCIGTTACYCVDSTGQAKVESAAIAADSTVCP